MDLSNKEIDIEFMSSNMVLGTSTVTVTVSVDIADGVKQRLASYKLDFAGVSYTSTSDPKLIAALQAKLESLPEPV